MDRAPSDARRHASQLWFLAAQQQLIDMALAGMGIPSHALVSEPPFPVGAISDISIAQAGIMFSGRGCPRVHRMPGIQNPDPRFPQYPLRTFIKPMLDFLPDEGFSRHHKVWQEEIANRKERWPAAVNWSPHWQACHERARPNLDPIMPVAQAADGTLQPLPVLQSVSDWAASQINLPSPPQSEI